MKEIVWCTSSPFLGWWEPPFDVFIRVVLYPQRWILKRWRSIFLPHSHTGPKHHILHFYFLLGFSSFVHWITVLQALPLLNIFKMDLLKMAKIDPKLFDWHFYSSDIPIQNDGQLLPLIGSLYVIILQWKSLYVIIMQRPFLHTIPSITTIRNSLLSNSSDIQILPC